MKKFIQHTLMLTAALMIQICVQAQTTKTNTTKFWVAGVCGQCETTIEKAMDTKGVVTADYDLSTNMLTVVYKPKKISEDKLHQLLNEVGYDTEKSTCSDAQYNGVHGCCKYRELEKH